jgi:hypothetical protein
MQFVGILTSGSTGCWISALVCWPKRVFRVSVLIAALVFPTIACADGLSIVKACETDDSPPEEIARLTILPSGESRGSTTAAILIRTARQKAKEGKNDEAIQWALLCEFESKEQDAIRRDRAAVLEYLKR